MTGSFHQNDVEISTTVLLDPHNMTLRNPPKPLPTKGVPSQGIRTHFCSLWCFAMLLLGLSITMTGILSSKTVALFNQAIFDMVQDLHDGSLAGAYVGDLSMQLRDFARLNAGGRIDEALTTQKKLPLHLYPICLIRYMWGYDDQCISVSPDVVLNPELYPGRCWSIEGVGSIGITLPSKLSISHITVGHTRTDNMTMASSAPRLIEVWGVASLEASNLDSIGPGHPGLRWKELRDQIGGGSGVIHDGLMSAKEVLVRLTKVEYSPNRMGNFQTFLVDKHVLEMGLRIRRVKVEILSNWGGLHTCIYNIQLHGSG